MVRARPGNRHQYNAKSITFGSQNARPLTDYSVTYIKSDLRYLCLFAYSGVMEMLCCGFVLFVFFLFPVSLDCLFLFCPSVFSNVYLPYIIYIVCPLILVLNIDYIWKTTHLI
jgi:hypothetical protein